MRAYEALAQQLQDLGVDTVFGLLGDDTVLLGAELGRRGVQFHASRHENNAVSMADGYSQVTGRVGVVINSRGPGFLNSVNALASVARAGSSVVFITGDAPSGSARSIRSDWKFVDHGVVSDLLGSHFVTPPTAVEVPQATRTAVRHAQRLGAAILSVPSDFMTAEIGDVAHSPADDDPVGTAPVDPQVVNDLAEFLTAGFASTRPVILAGRGAVKAGAEKPLLRLAELTGAVVCTTMQGRSLFQEDPFALGVCGGCSTPLASELIVRSDVVLAFGASLNNDTSFKKELFANTRIIQVDSDRAAFGAFVEPDLAVEGDAAAVAQALVTELEQRGHSAVGLRTEENRERIKHANYDETFRELVIPGTIDPRVALRELDTWLPRDRVIAVDGGHYMVWSFEFLSVIGQRGFVHPNSNWYSIGLGLGAALGAAVGRPDATTVLNIGDTGMMMNLGDLETAVRLNLPMLILLFNNGAWGSEALILRSAGLPEDVSIVPVPDFAAVMRAMGGRAYTIDSLDALRAVAGELDRVGRGPLLLDCRISLDLP